MTKPFGDSQGVGNAEERDGVIFRPKRAMKVQRMGNSIEFDDINWYQSFFFMAFPGYPSITKSLSVSLFLRSHFLKNIFKIR